MHILEFLYIENGKILKENKFGKNLKKKKGENIYFFTLASKKFWAFRLTNLIILIIDSIKNYLDWVENVGASLSVEIWGAEFNSSSSS